MGQIEYTGRDNLEVMKEAKNYNRYLIDLILAQVQINELTIDFGAGSGTFSLPIAKAGNRIICVETDPVLSLILFDSGLEVVSSLEEIDDCSVDYIYSLNVLEHIEYDDVIIRLWMQKLRPGGRLFVYVPAFDILFSSMDRKVGHFRRYSKKIIKSKLKNAGFQVLDTKYADGIGFFATLIYKFFDDGGGDINLRMLKFYDKWVFPLSRIFDPIASSFVGKNIYARAVKPL